MRSLQYYHKYYHYFQIVTKFNLAIFAGISTWVIAMLSNGPEFFTTPKIASPIAISLCVLGASLWHFGANNPMYARKNETFKLVPMFRKELIILGLVAMTAAIYITYSYLNISCQIIVLLDVIIIVLYAGVLSRHWLTKNLLMAFVCVSPVLLGWFAGERLHPLVPYGIAITFFSYLAREIVKDIQDRVANCGHRITLPLWLGVVLARRIAAGVMFVALMILAIFSFKLLDNSSVYIIIPLSLVWLFWLRTTYSLAFDFGGEKTKDSKQEAKESKHILLGSLCLMLTFLMLIF